MLPTVKNPTFTFDLTQIQVVPFQCNQFFIYPQTVTVEILSWGDPGKKRKQIENDDKKQKKKKHLFLKFVAH
jgi:hypothetical protein